MFLPLNSNLAKAKALITVTINDNTVDTKPTYNVLTNNLPNSAVWKAFT